MFLLQCIFPDHFYAKNQIYMLLPHAQIYICCIFAIELCYYFFFKISDHYEMCQYLAFRPCFIFCTLDS